MAPPTKTFTVIPDSAIDPDSPITTTLMTNLRDNDIHLEEWLGKNFVAAIDHDHDGVNSANVAGNNLRFIEAIEVTGAAVASVTFSGLDGNADVHYVLYGTVIPSVAIINLQLRFNSLVGNYDNSDTAAANGIIIDPALALTINIAKFQAQIYAKNLLGGTDIFPSASIESNDVTFTTVARFENAGARSSVVLPAPNITALQIITDTGGTPIGIGSRFSLYKLAEN